MTDPLKRDEAIRRVNAFLQANYPCQECEGDECDELDEAATIVDIVEEIYFPEQETVERVAKAWYEDSPSLVWAQAHPGDQESARSMVRFVLDHVGWKP